MTRSVAWVVGVGLAMGSSTWAGAQQPARNCDSIVGAAKVGTVESGLFLSLRQFSENFPDPDRVRTMALHIGAAFTPPRPFRLSVFGGPSLIRGIRALSVDGPTIRTPTVTGIYRIRLSSDDTAPPVMIVRQSMIAGFDSAAVEAIRDASAIRAAFAAATADSILIDVVFSSDSTPSALRLFSAAFPRIPIVDAVPRADNPPAEYPPEVKNDTTETQVVFRLIVGADGAPEAGTVEVVRGRSIPFVRAAYNALQRQRFTAATIGGCPVAQQIDYPFAFILPKSPPQH